MDDRLARDIDLAVTRLRSLRTQRLAAPVPGGGTISDAAHALAQALADGAADIAMTPRRRVPRLGDQAVADQIAVTGHDLVACVSDHPDADGDVVTAAVEAVARLRAVLP